VLTVLFFIFLSPFDLLSGGEAQAEPGISAWFTVEQKREKSDERVVDELETVDSWTDCII